MVKERKGGMKSLGWIFCLIVIGLGLVIYNLKYLPLQEEHNRLVNENLMWQTQVKDLQSKLNGVDSGLQPSFSQTFLWDDLFAELGDAEFGSAPSGFTLTEPAQLILKEIIPDLQATTNEIIVAGHSDNQPILPELKKTFATDRELSYAKAMVIVNTLQSWGIKKERLVCIGYGDTKPVDSSNTPEARSKNRRIEIIVK
jgi:outer membrane protein OmpA-like peptidoglycan-associated protein